MSTAPDQDTAADALTEASPENHLAGGGRCSFRPRGDNLRCANSTPLMEGTTVPRPPTPACNHPLLRCIGWGCVATAGIGLLIGPNLTYSASPQPAPAVRDTQSLSDPEEIVYDTVDGHHRACLRRGASEEACVYLDSDGR